MTDSNLHQLLLERHSIRRYTDQQIPADNVKTILEAALMAALAECKDFGGKPIAKAAMAVAVVADPLESDCWLEDSSIAAIFMHLQAAALGIGSCWIQVMGRDKGEESAEDIVRSILDIPESLKIPCIMTFGYQDETRKPVDPDKLLWEKIHIGKWRHDNQQ